MSISHALPVGSPSRFVHWPCVLKGAPGDSPSWLASCRSLIVLIEPPPPTRVLLPPPHPTAGSLSPNAEWFSHASPAFRKPVPVTTCRSAVASDSAFWYTFLFPPPVIVTMP